MPVSPDPSRLSNLYKPAIIMISVYLVVHLAGFFVQHDFSPTAQINAITSTRNPALEFIPLKEKKVITPAPPEVNMFPRKTKKISGQTIHPHLP